MMKKLLTLLLVTLFVVSCEDNGMNYSHADYLKMMAAINQDEMVDLDAIDDDGIQDEDYDETLYDMDFTSSRIDPFPTDGSAVFRFGRKVENRTRDIQFDCTDCDVAIATITQTQSGTFYAKAYNKESHEEIDSFEKAFSETFVKQARLEKKDNAENPDGYVWRITAVSIGTGGAGSKLSVDEVRIYAPMDSDEAVYTLNASDGSLIDKESMPKLAIGESFRIEVSVSNSDPVLDFRSGEAVNLHVGKHKKHKARRGLRDGVQADDGTITYDNVFVRRLKVPKGAGSDSKHRRPLKMHFGALDFGTMLDSDAGYYSSVLAFPFHVYNEGDTPRGTDG
jgi:hypothetical protein